MTVLQIIFETIVLLAFFASMYIITILLHAMAGTL